MQLVWATALFGGFLLVADRVLLVLAGSTYHFKAGIVMIVIGALTGRGYRRRRWLFAELQLGTCASAEWEVGFDWF